MKVKQLSALVGLAGTALIASPADAAFTGFDIRNIDALMAGSAFPAVANGWAALGGSLQVYRIYAQFDASGDNVVAVFGDNGRRAFLNVTGGTIHNSTFTTQYSAFIDTHLAPTPAFFAPQHSNGAAAWDTYVTINTTSTPTAVSQDPDFWGNTGGDDITQTGALSTNWDTDINGDIAWFLSGFPVEGDVGGSLEVLVMQITVTTGAIVEGNFGIQLQDEGITHTDDGLGGLHHFIIPSPGAFALLGLAGLTGVRRRRRH